MIARRALLIGAGLAPLGSRAWAGDGVPRAGALTFRVSRNGSDIGRHALSFTRDADTVTAKINVQLAVKFGPITFFRYHHEGTEVSRTSQFVSLDTRTDNDGENLRVTARRDGDHVVVESSKLGKKLFPENARPLTHWNRACMSAPLFNPQDGKPLDLKVAERGAEMVALDGGATARATHYAMTGEDAVDDWYGDDDVWTALRAIAKDGSTIIYRRMA